MTLLLDSVMTDMIMTVVGTCQGEMHVFTVSRYCSVLWIVQAVELQAETLDFL